MIVAENLAQTKTQTQNLNGKQHDSRHNFNPKEPKQKQNSETEDL
jgi:hypothetical protein